MSRYLEIKEKQPAGFSPSLKKFFLVYENGTASAESDETNG
jgi:hypothetical protein